MTARFAAAWHRAEAGEAVDDHHLSFDSFETMVRVLTPRRLDLLRTLRSSPASSIAALSRAAMPARGWGAPPEETNSAAPSFPTPDPSPEGEGS